MNIFYLSDNPYEAAQMQCDKHVVKMILESAQMLSTTHRECDGIDTLQGEPLYKKTHVNHPCTAWVRESKDHYIWLYQHFRGLLAEYTRRYGKQHKCERFIFAFKNIPKNIGRRRGFSHPPACMPEQYITDNVVESYRNYYLGEKMGFAQWKLGNKPEWVR